MDTETHCPYCSLQCGMRLESTSCRELTVAPWPEFPTNAGGLCRKGWTAPALLRHRERLTSPLVRDRATGELTAVSWDEALDRVAAGLVEIQERHGRDSVGVFGGGGLTNEKAYALGKFARVALRTSAIDYNGRWCMSSAATAGQRAFGLDRGLPFPLADIEDASVVVLVGSNLAETAPPAARHLEALKDNGGTLVVIDPRATATAARADVHVQPVPGTDLALANGVLHAIVSDGQVDQDYVDARTSGFDQVRQLVAGYWPERVERITGVSAPEIVGLARLLAQADSVIILTARGAEQHASGTDTVLAWINVALALGQPGRPHAGYGCITGQGNGQGGREHGQKADQLPGYRKIDDPAARAHVAQVWGIEPDDLPGPGRSAYEMLDAMGTDGGVRALLVFGSNIVVSAPNASHIGDRLDALDLLVVADFVMSETAARADVVLPVTQWAEETGTMTNLEGRVILRRQALTPPDGVRSDLDVISGLAQRLGVATGFDTDPEVVFDELRRASAGGPADYSGIDYGRITRELGVFWPCPDTGDETAHPGTPGCSLTGSPRRTAGPASTRSTTSVRPSSPRPIPVLPDHRQGARAVPERRPDPPGPRARRRRTGSVRRAAPDGRGPARASWTASRSGWQRGAARWSRRPGSRPTSAATPCSCRSTGSAPTCSPTTRSTPPRGCRSSRPARRRWSAWAARHEPGEA